MLHLKHLSKVLRSFKPSTTCPKLVKTIQTPLKMASSFQRSLLTNNKSLGKAGFSSTNQGCGKISDIFEELSETLRNNIQEIINLLPGRGINVSSFCLNRFAKMGYTENLGVYEILYNNLEGEIENTHNRDVIFSILEGLHFIENSKGVLPPIPETLLQKVAKQVLKLNPLFSTKNIQELSNFLKVFEQRSIPEIKEFLVLNSVSRPFSNGEFLDAFDAKNLYSELNEVFQITQFDMNRNYIQIKYIPNDQTLDIFGTESFPSQSIEHVVEFLKQNPSEINSLIIQDSPLFFPTEDPETASDPNVKIPEQIEKNDSSLLYELQGEDLNFYVQSFVTDEDMFQFDQPNGIVYSKINPKVSIPSEAGTIGFHFYVNADPRTNPKITLLDLTIPELIGKMATLFNVKQLKELLELFNYCTLIEKTYFSHKSQLEGCVVCKGPEATNLHIPKDMISIVAGDKELPTDFKTKFFSKVLFEYLRSEDTEHTRTLLVTDHVFTIDILKGIMEFMKDKDNKKDQEFNRVEYGNKMIMELSRKRLGGSSDIVEKLAILETVFQVVDNEGLRELARTNRDLNMEHYLRYIDEYAEELSYEKLTSKNKDVKIRPGECGAETLIFGVGPEDQGITSSSEEKGGQFADLFKRALEEEEAESNVQKIFEKKEEKKIKFKGSNDDKGKKKK